MESLISLIIADDHTLLREGLLQLLHDEPDIRVLGEAAAGEEMLDLVEKLRPDVILLDLDLPENDLGQGLPQIRTISSLTRILLLVDVFDQQNIGRVPIFP
ncbi:MAG: hypothetical protein ETSY2_28990, partial [Candidatus Entotheonella gemina]